MEDPKGRQSFIRRKKMTKQLTGKREDTPLHAAARGGDVDGLRQILEGLAESGGLDDALAKQNHAGETPFFVAAEYGYVDLVTEFLRVVDVESASIRAKTGYDALHIAAKQGDLDVVKELLNSLPELAKTVDLANTTALHTAAAQGHLDMVNLLLEADASLAKIAKSNGKTALHSVARNGYLEVLRALLRKEPRIVMRVDKKGQTALHMAVKGQNLEVVEELLKWGAPLINAVDNKGNTALHIASRKGRAQQVKRLLECEEMDTKIVNRGGETVLDTAEKAGHADIASMLREAGVERSKCAGPTNAAKELKQSVSDIKHEVHSQLETTRQTQKGVRVIAKNIKKLHGGLNNAINSTTVVAVLIATVAFAAIFTVPGQYVSDPSQVTDELSLGAAYISPQVLFQVFLIFDSAALFISLAVVVVQTSVVVIESEAKKQMMAVINKLMWLACVLMSVAFISLSFIVVGDDSIGLAIAVAVIGTFIMVTTLGGLCYLIVRYRMDVSNRRSMRRSSTRSLSKSWSFSPASDSEFVNGENKAIYAL